MVDCLGIVGSMDEVVDLHRLNLLAGSLEDLEFEVVGAALKPPSQIVCLPFSYQYSGIIFVHKFILFYILSEIFSIHGVSI